MVTVSTFHGVWPQEPLFRLPKTTITVITAIFKNTVHISSLYLQTFSSHYLLL